MEDLTQIPQLTLNLFGFSLVFNIETILMTWIVLAALITFGFLATKKIENDASGVHLSVMYLDPLLALVGTGRIEAGHESTHLGEKNV